MNTPSNSLTSRREFLKASALAGSVLAAPAFLPGPLFAKENTDTLRVGLIGCGGRGSGAASQALHADKNVVLTAMGDAFEEPLQRSLSSLQKEHADKVKVTPDAPGVRSVLESVKASKEKNLALVAGFCWRYEVARKEFYKRVHDGAIGDLRAIYATYYTGPVKPMPAAGERPSGMGDLEWQVRNWYNFVWLSGDGYVEQAIHSVDKVAWAMKDQPPLKAVAVGGRQTPNNQGDIYDHMFVVYEYPDDVRAFVGQRQIAHTYSENSDYLMGSAGFGRIPGLTLKGKESWRFKGPTTDMYQNEHDELFASIRNGKPINDGERMAHSTLMGLMGRMAAYTGQEITWEQALNSQEKLVPDQLDWKMKLDFPPMAGGRQRLRAGENEGDQGGRLRGHRDDEPHGPGRSAARARRKRRGHPQRLWA